MVMKGADLDEIEALYRGRFDAFIRTATAICGDSDAGRDAVQEAFASAVRRRSTFRRDGTLEAWLWSIIVNEARSRARRRDPVPGMRTAPSEDGRGSETDALRAALAALPERQRLAAFLRYYADLDYAGIAAVLGISPGTVGATLNAAHAALRQRLEEVPS
jgi:RNA polymerase sigma-70 factor (ECF subfamily)